MPLLTRDPNKLKTVTPEAGPVGGNLRGQSWMTVLQTYIPLSQKMLDKRGPWGDRGCPPHHDFLTAWGLISISLSDSRPFVWIHIWALPFFPVTSMISNSFGILCWFSLYDTDAFTFGSFAPCTWTWGKRSGWGLNDSRSPFAWRGSNRISCSA